MTPEAIALAILVAGGVVCVLLETVKGIAIEVAKVRIEKHRAAFAQARAKEAEWASQQAKSAAVVEVARARRGEVSE